MGGYHEYEPVDWGTLPDAFREQLIVAGRCALELAGGHREPGEFETVTAVFDVPGPGAYVGGSPEERYEQYLADIGIEETDLQDVEGTQQLLVQPTETVPASVMLEDCRVEAPDSAFERYRQAASRRFMSHLDADGKRRVRALLSTEGRARLDEQYDGDYTREPP
jgi:hypothetical protein